MSSPYRFAVGTAVLVVSAFFLVAQSVPDATPAIQAQAASAAIEQMQTRPDSFAFEANQGQTASHVDFVARGPGYGLFLTPTEAVFSLSPAAAALDPDALHGARADRLAPSVLRMALIGGNPAPEATGENLLDGTSHYFTGKDPEKWQRNVSRFGKVRYAEVYPGVDMVYYGADGKLEYDFIVAPGRDPGKIALDFKGVEGIRLDEAGNLLLKTAHGDLVQHKPVIYQLVDGARRMIEGAYALLGGNGVGFKLGQYDLNLPLVIDPVLSYSTYVGGDGWDSVAAIGVDAAGNTYVAGNTNSIEFPWDMGNDSEFSGIYDAYVCRFTAAGGKPYCAYIGGTGDDAAWALAVGGNGSAYVGGFTSSTDFPVINAQQPNPAAGTNGDAFVLKIDPTGTMLAYSTYYGGNDADVVRALAVDDQGAAYITGNTWSWQNFPITAGVLQPVDPADVDAFVAKFNNSGALAFSSYLGGSGNDQGRGITLDKNRNIYVSGMTASTNFAVTAASNFPTPSAVQPLNAGGNDAFIAKLNPTGSALLYGTYLGGTGDEWGYGLQLDAAGNIHLAGFTSSTDFPTTVGAIQRTYGGDQDGFLTKLNANGSQFVYSTYLGGSGRDDLRHLVLDPAGNAYLAGDSVSPDFPLVNPLQSMNEQQGVLAKIDPTGKKLMSSTALGGSGWDLITGVARSMDGTLHVSGYTVSTNFPLASAFQATNSSATIDPGVPDIFFTRITDATLASWRGDFDGDGASDILWHNAATGAGSIWPSANGAQARTLTRVTDLNWHIVAVADFNGDGKSDILWRNALTGSNTIWRSGDYALQQAVTGVTNTNWKIAGAGDFDGDRKADILWRDTATGTNAIWLAANNATQRAVTGVTNLGWEVIGVNDFNGDRRADILWRNTSNAQTAIWNTGNSATSASITGVLGTDWRIVGIADFDGDGKADILWRNAATGNNTIWRSGASSTQQAVAPIPNYDWHPVGTGDYNKDGKADILWRHRANGNNTIWRSGNSTTIQAVSPAGLDWRVRS